MLNLLRDVSSEYLLKRSPWGRTYCVNSLWRDIGGVSLPGEFGSECHLDEGLLLHELGISKVEWRTLRTSIRGETQCRVASVKIRANILHTGEHRPWTFEPRELCVSASLLNALNGLPPYLHFLRVSSNMLIACIRPGSDLSLPSKYHHELL